MKLFLKATFLLLLISLACNAQLSKQLPQHTIGSEFLFVNYDSSNYKQTFNIPPRVIPLFDNTNIYVDLNNDGLWDYTFLKDQFEVLILKLDQATINRGARLQADKPIIYYDQSTGYDLIVHSPTNAYKKDQYLVGHSDIAYFVAPQNTVVEVDDDLDGDTDFEIIVQKGKSISQYIRSTSHLTSDKPFYAYNALGTTSNKAKTFYTIGRYVRLQVLEDDTEVFIDFNADGLKDYNYSFDAGAQDLVLETIGALIKSDKEILVFNNDRYSGTGFNTIDLMPCEMLNNEVYTFSGSRVLGLFGPNNSEYDNTILEVDDQFESINPNTYAVVEGSGLKHVVLNSPANVYFYHTTEKFIQYSAYASIFATTYPKTKYMQTDETIELVTRVFNTFSNTVANDFIITQPINPLFATDNKVLVTVILKRLVDDSIVDSDTFSKEAAPGAPLIIDDGDSKLFDELPALHYYDIIFELLSPSEYGLYSFGSASITFDANTWQCE
ncbi:hypothetical protein GOV04_00150 [Candidatus Woesearchaeota archaeon]|nr:hypothetical protein [Candidatus Woesearchaeota archaeon]